TSISLISTASSACIPLRLRSVFTEAVITAATESGLAQPFTILVTAVIVITPMLTFAYSFRYIIGSRGATKHSIAEAKYQAEEGGYEPAPVETITEAKPTVWIIPAILALVTVVLGLVPSLLNW